MGSDICLFCEVCTMESGEKIWFPGQEFAPSTWPLAWFDHEDFDWDEESRFYEYTDGSMAAFCRFW